MLFSPFYICKRVWICPDTVVLKGQLCLVTIQPILNSPTDNEGKNKTRAYISLTIKFFANKSFLQNKFAESIFRFLRFGWHQVQNFTLSIFFFHFLFTAEFQNCIPLKWPTTATESFRLSVTNSSPRYLTDEFFRTLL